VFVSVRGHRKSSSKRASIAAGSNFEEVAVAVVGGFRECSVVGVGRPWGVDALTIRPTLNPTTRPTKAPTDAPTARPTNDPTVRPTVKGCFFKL
jgi:hypothetical protein